MKGYALEVGGRYWYSTGRDQFNLYDVPGTSMVSRLTWDDLKGHSGEAFFRLDTAFGVFVKGYIGGGVLGNGTMQDEDFPPFIVPYSSTDSSAQGSLAYGSVDVGYNVVNTRKTKLGPFVGYHYWKDKDEAFGCVQTAGNPAVCVPAIPSSVLGITEEFQWNALRLGVSGDWTLARYWRLQAEAAYARGWLDASDTHWLRQNQPGGFAGSTPIDGASDGVQLEAILSYQFTDCFSLGVGGRYWKYNDADGHAHFEQSAIPVGASQPQVSKTNAERYGLLLEGAYHF